MSDLFKWLQKVPGVLTIFLVIALGVTLANLLWMIVTPAPSDAVAGGLINTNQAPVLAPQKNYGKLIADQHLFGVIPKVVPKKVKKPAPVKVAKPVKPPVRLNLKLHGIVSSKGNDGGFAMISYNGKAQEVFSPGEPIPKQLPGQDTVKSIGVMVTKITKESVTIDNNGTEQILELPAPAKSKAVKNNRRKAPRVQKVVARPKVIQPTNNASQTPTLGKSGGIQTLAQLREEAMVNPNVVMTILTPSVVRENGQITGVRVYPSRNRKLFRALGFRNGDVITQVNGIVIDDQSKGIAIMQQLTDASSLEIHIKRGGNVQILTPQF